MRINLWMIANLLDSEKCTLEIGPNDKMELFGAGFRSAPGRACISQVGEDVICAAESGRIILHDTPLLDAFEQIQQAFDVYNEWGDATEQACFDGDWQTVVDGLEPLFPYPVVMYNSSFSVLAMSSRYGFGSVDEEWDYMLNSGESSSAKINGDQESPGFVDIIQNADRRYLLTPHEGSHPGFLTAVIRDGMATVAYLSAVAKTGFFTHGQVDVAEKLLDIVTRVVSAGREARGSSIAKEAFKDFLTDPDASDFVDLTRSLSIYGWPSDARFSLLCFYYNASDANERIYRAFIKASNMVKVPIVTFEDKLVFILNQDDPNCAEVRERVMSMPEAGGMLTLESNVADHIQSIYYCYDQIEFIISRLRGGKKRYYHFYDFAIHYLILHSDRQSLIHACNPEILALFNKENGMDFAYALETYLKSDRSVQDAAKTLYIHKNTLSYRVKKVLASTTIDINDMYSRSYAILSFDVLHALGY